MSHVLGSIDHTICSFSSKLSLSERQRLPLRISFYIGDSFLGGITTSFWQIRRRSGGRPHQQ
jgi:hypothetical protein